LKMMICPEWLTCGETNCCHRRPHIEKMFCILTTPYRWCWESVQGGGAKGKEKPNCIELKKEQHGD
jgi:hypothetical protein